MPSFLTMILAVPKETPVTKPVLSTVAAVSSEDVNVTPSRDVGFVTTICTVFPASTSSSAFSTSIFSLTGAGFTTIVALDAA